eukprot:m51a1_g14580 hypothetical protein (367) ;mRNA; r:1116250-1117584
MAHRLPLLLCCACLSLSPGAARAAVPSVSDALRVTLARDGAVVRPGTVVRTAASSSSSSSSPSAALVAWTGASDGRVHVARAGDDDDRLPRAAGDVVCDAGAAEAWGLVAHDDGGFAVLLWAAPAVVLARYDARGAKAWSATLETSRAAADAPLSAGSNSRLAFARGQYWAQYRVRGTASSCYPASNGYDGDTVASVAADGSNATTRACWGCSQPADNAIGADDALGVLPACVSDCYPRKGVLLDSGVFDLQFAPGDCAGNASAAIGGVWAENASSWAVAFAAPRDYLGAPSTTGGGGLSRGSVAALVICLGVVPACLGAAAVAWAVWRRRKGLPVVPNRVSAAAKGAVATVRTKLGRSPPPLPPK